ncbi:MAG TPA: hypothetical protein DDW65_13825 [Firmicutes bacterium]|jgi:nitrogenase molybdenum-iron protein beta chain|nr:hypothetical protein [Bacillota bacterium]
MKTIIANQVRTFCALGAQQTVAAIDGAVPILYAARTCTYRLHQGMSECNGHQGSGNLGGSSVICTGMHNIPVPNNNTTDTLINAIQTAIKITDAELYVVLSGCIPELIGEDTGAIVARYRSQGFPLVYAEMAGFRGNAYSGHEWVTKAIVKQYVTSPARVNPRLVNLWASVPYLDPFWSGNLNALKYLLEQLGLQVNVMFGVYSSPGSWRKIPSAAVNLIVSSWVGLDVAQYLKSKFDTPYLHYPVLPIGAGETSKFLRWITDKLHLDRLKTSVLIAGQEKEFYDYLKRMAEFLVKYRRDFPERFFMIADSTYVSSVSRFLINEIGLLPGCQYVIDDPPKCHQAGIIRQFEADVGIVPEVVFIDDLFGIKGEIEKKLDGRVPLILGSSWDADMAGDLGGYYLGISSPLTERLVLNHTYVGYDGALRLLEDIYGKALEQCG